jgi:long-chain fatty acid transport protein
MRRALIAMAVVLCSQRAAANPVDGFGLGSRSTAMGGAVSASVRDFSASYYNPSGLALARGTDLSVGYVYVSQKLEINGHDSQVDPVRAIVGGIVAPGSIWTIPFAFGLAVHLPDDRLSRARSMRPEDPRWVLWDNRPQLLYLSANLAIRPVEWLAIGGGVSFLAATRGAFEVTGTAVLPQPSGERTEYDSQLRHEVDADLTAVRYPAFGITVTPNDWLDFGLVYRDEAKIELEIDAELRGTVDTGLIPVPARYELESTTMNAFIPRQLVLGGSAVPTEGLRIGLDVTWVNWAAYESPISRSRSVLDVNVPAGFELPPNPKPTGRVDPGFKNRLVPRVGVEYRLAVRRSFDIPLYAGYFFEQSPVPPQTGRTNFVDADRHVLSLGSGFIWSDPAEILPGNLRFDTHVQWAILPEKTTLKDNPADYVGDSRAGGSQLGVGATLSLGFL